MKQSTRATTRQLTLWLAREDDIRPIEQMPEEVTNALAELLLEALGLKLPANQTGGDDESEDLA
ncbi:MAG: hypothetical protein L6Q68_13620 [Aquabacterium sp.]|nr:hypothetical protein [Aquabacterium sp.]